MGPSKIQAMPVRPLQMSRMNIPTIPDLRNQSGTNMSRACAEMEEFTTRYHEAIRVENIISYVEQGFLTDLLSDLLGNSCQAYSLCTP